MKKVISLVLALLLLCTLSLPALADSELDYEDEGLIDEAEASLPAGDADEDPEEEEEEAPAQSSGFSDVAASDYYYDAVNWAVAQGVTSGASGNAFSPNKPCTRGEMVTFLWRAAGRPEPSTLNSSFTDVPANSYFYKPVLWAVEQGITSGTSDRTFSPNDICTRSQTVTFLWRSAGKPAVNAGTRSFSDVSQSSYYYQPTIWAAEKGITSGSDATHFAPNASCTRGQTVTFLYRYMNSRG